MGRRFTAATRHLTPPKLPTQELQTAKEKNALERSVENYSVWGGVLKPVLLARKPHS